MLSIEREKHWLRSDEIGEDQIVVIPEEIGAYNTVSFGNKELSRKAYRMSQTGCHDRKRHLLILQMGILLHHAVAPERTKSLIATTWCIIENLRRLENTFLES